MSLTPPDSSSIEGNSLPQQNQSFDVVDALVGRNLGHFRVGERLGSGAMAAVYRARDLILERDVALKVLLPGADDVVRARFRQEARTVSVLDHPHIVHTLQVGQTDGITEINLSTVVAGQFVGIREVADKIWLVSFLDFDLGFFDEVAARVDPGPNPFTSKVLTMCPV